MVKGTVPPRVCVHFMLFYTSLRPSFYAGEAMQASRPTSASGEDDDEDADRSEEYSDDGRLSD